jgi:NAD(P)-dependent dehydrogenase (short-subunit alcohol dehydrogenase family)
VSGTVTHEGRNVTKTWLITGSSRGFGRELARVALAAGDQVLATARDPRQLRDLIDGFPRTARAVALDVTDPGAAKAGVETAIGSFGSLDIVVNNAGYANSAPIEHTPLEDFRAQFETNFFGVLNLTQAALPVFRQQRSGHFLQFSSIGGRVGGSPGLAAYQSAKFAVEGLSEVLNAEVTPFGVKVTIIEPGGFRTDWGGSSMQAAPVAPDYDQTVGAMNRYRESTVATWAGDPARAARIILDITRTENPPLRLLLGAGAVETAAKSSQSRAAEADLWAAVSRSADFPDETTP